MTDAAAIERALAEARRNDPPEYYAPEDDCTTGLCDLEGLFIPHEVGNIELDKAFIGSEVDTELDLDLANIDTLPLSDEAFPVIFDDALITLDGLLDCFGRKYPERAHLLATLIEKNGYEIEWIEEPTAEEQSLERELAVMPREHFEWHGNAGSHNYSPQQQQRRDEIQQRLSQIQHWRITDNKIILMPRINKNIDEFNWRLGIDDTDLINHFPTNAEGADWLNAVMGDWMAHSGIPGAYSNEEFTDSYSSRITWGSLNIVLGGAEVVGGILLLPTGAVSYGAGTVAGVAMTVAGFDAFTQGLDMLSTPEESEHSTGWLGDGVRAMCEEFGYINEDNSASFDKYWSFAMLGLSLGGTGVVAALPRAAQRVTLNSSRSVFNAEIVGRPLTHAKMALAGVKNASLGKLRVSFVTLPSARTVFNVTGIGKFVAPAWDSLPRLRLRSIADDVVEVQHRARKLADGEAGLISLRGGMKSQADAQKLVEEAAAAMGIGKSRLRRIISKVELGELSRSSSFSTSKVIRIRPNIGKKLDGSGEYNEFRALTEVMHELTHAMRLEQWVKSGKSPGEYWTTYRQGSAQYHAEEVYVETSAMQRTKSLVDPRIKQEIQFGSEEKANHLQYLLNQAIEDSHEYINYHSRRAGQ